MNQPISLSGTTRAMAELERAFQFGRSAERPGIITAAHTATWHVAGMIERLRSLRDDCMESIRRGELSVGPVRPDEEPTP